MAPELEIKSLQTIDVLIVEDESRLAENHAEFIRNHFQFRAVGIAANLGEARQMMQSLKPRLVLLDNYLPDGWGIELMEDIVSFNYNCRVIFITAASDMETCAKAIRYGTFDYIIKPVSYERLRRSLERFVRVLNAQQSSDHVNQHRVDEMFNLHSKNFQYERHSKGIEELTLKRIMDIFSVDGKTHTADSVAKEVGTSKTTARRYLEYCVETRFLAVEISYGKIGRPERIYKKNGV